MPPPVSSSRQIPSDNALPITMTINQSDLLT
jgi:hypothetical protein